MERETNAWSVARAKAELSRVIEQAISAGPQVITRRGRKAVVVVSAEDWERRARRKGSLTEFFAASPLRGSGLQVRRTKDHPRDVDLC